MFLSLFFMPKSVFGAAARVFEVPVFTVGVTCDVCRKFLEAAKYEPIKQSILTDAYMEESKELLRANLELLPENWQIKVLSEFLGPRTLKTASLYDLMESIEEARGTCLNRKECHELIACAEEHQWSTREIPGYEMIYAGIIGTLRHKAASALTLEGKNLLWRT